MGELAVSALARPADRDAFIRGCAEGAAVVDVPASAAAIIGRHAGIAVVMNEFYRQLMQERRTVPYPLDELERARARSWAPGPR